jgi:hypothetical protein
MRNIGTSKASCTTNEFEEWCLRNWSDAMEQLILGIDDVDDDGTFAIVRDGK